MKQILIKNSDKKYQQFSASLLPNIDNVLGVRLPILRKIAKDIYKNHDWQTYINSNNDEFMEETMLKGMIIGLIESEPEKILKYITDFVPKINNWSVCDSFCSGLKFAKSNKKIVWKFLQPYFIAQKEYELRFAYVMGLNYFICEDYIDKFLSKIDKFNDENYYSKMAVAWALSICYIKFPQKTFDYLHKSKLSNWTFNKAIQKCLESNKIDVQTKTKLKELKKSRT